MHAVSSFIITLGESFLKPVSTESGDKAVTAVYDISTWKKIGYKRLLKKPACVMSVSLDGKYLAL